ncbi:hypothetical protein BT96DRAFT_994227 [Gymnopus androsaceus JB14]|uniref:Uncharacterized protein n=1 Tax=Gymnopus androsaceus JB14 TaxID=1447944 RepID=A0A6A4HM05_9AGAR|nr:hypothetical protein BT96DRAFT_994227 [Gymnopus androsaceus JB14]
MTPAMYYEREYDNGSPLKGIPFEDTLYYDLTSLNWTQSQVEKLDLSDEKTLKVLVPLQRRIPTILDFVINKAFDLLSRDRALLVEYFPASTAYHYTSTYLETRDPEGDEFDEIIMSLRKAFEDMKKKLSYYHSQVAFHPALSRMDQQGLGPEVQSDDLLLAHLNTDVRGIANHGRSRAYLLANCELHFSRALPPHLPISMASDSSSSAMSNLKKEEGGEFFEFYAYGGLVGVNEDKTRDPARWRLEVKLDTNEKIAITAIIPDTNVRDILSRFFDQTAVSSLPFSFYKIRPTLYPERTLLYGKKYKQMCSAAEKNMFTITRTSLPLLVSVPSAPNFDLDHKSCYQTTEANFGSIFVPSTPRQSSFRSLASATPPLPTVRRKTLSWTGITASYSSQSMLATKTNAPELPPPQPRARNPPQIQGVSYKKSTTSTASGTTTTTTTTQELTASTSTSTSTPTSDSSSSTNHSRFIPWPFWQLFFETLATTPKDERERKPNSFAVLRQERKLRLSRLWMRGRLIFSGLRRVLLRKDLGSRY